MLKIPKEHVVFICTKHKNHEYNPTFMGGCFVENGCFSNGWSGHDVPAPFMGKCVFDGAPMRKTFFGAVCNNCGQHYEYRASHCSCGSKIRCEYKWVYRMGDWR